MDTNVLAELIEFLPDAAFVIDGARRVVAWNRAMEDMTGTKKSDMIGQGCHAYAVPFYGRKRPILIDAAMQSAGAMPGLYKDVSRKGNTLCAEVQVDSMRLGRERRLKAVAVPLNDGNGNLLGAIEFIRDVTDCRNVRSGLREWEEKLQIITAVKERAEETLKKRETELEIKSKDLEELNTTLRVLLRQREQDRRDLTEGILSNIEALVMPFVEKLKKCRLDPNHMAYVEMIGVGLRDITSGFPKKVGFQCPNLTPAEIQIANLIKTGKTTKEISKLLGVSPGAINFHRNNIRKKLGLNRKKINLISHLSSLP